MVLKVFDIITAAELAGHGRDIKLKCLAICHVRAYNQITE
jgi:hypothetical protein